MKSIRRILQGKDYYDLNSFYVLAFRQSLYELNSDQNIVRKSQKTLYHLLMSLQLKFYDLNSCYGSTFISIREIQLWGGLLWLGVLLCLCCFG